MISLWSRLISLTFSASFLNLMITSLYESRRSFSFLSPFFPPTSNLARTSNGTRAKSSFSRIFFAISSNIFLFHRVSRQTLSVKKRPSLFFVDLLRTSSRSASLHSVMTNEKWLWFARTRINWQSSCFQNHVGRLGQHWHAWDFVFGCV